MAGIMRPTADITREETVVLIARAFYISQLIVEEDVPNTEGVSAWNSFRDIYGASWWAIVAIANMKAEGYINGDTAGNFNPKANITRAEVVTIIDNMIGLLNGRRQARLRADWRD